jgi:molybdenum cofactor cytidylyltransferase
MAAAPNFAVILLAAGSSSRLGSSKQLLKIKGKTLLERAITTALGVTPNVFVVLGANAPAHSHLTHKYPAEIVMNERWQDGMGTSIKAGIERCIQKQADIGGALIMVCDQPFLTTGHLRALIQKHIETAKPIAASKYAGTLGVPAYFSSAYFEELLRIRDDAGAKSIFKDHMSEIVPIEFPEGEIDIDTIDDVRKLDAWTG